MKAVHTDRLSKAMGDRKVGYEAANKVTAQLCNSLIDAKVKAKVVAHKKVVIEKIDTKFDNEIAAIFKSMMSDERITY